jgi:hypothetical protein
VNGAELEITRVAEGWRDRSRAYKVYVNGERRGMIRRGETKVLDVEPGQVKVQLRIDWCRSRKETIDLEPGSAASLRCGPRSALAGLYWITLGSRNYMWLESDAA